MNKFKFYFIVSCAAATLFSCGSKDDNSASPPRDYAVQYVADTTAINEYLKTYHIEITNNPSGNDDQDVVFRKADAEHLSMWDMYRHNATNDVYPKLLSKQVKLYGDEKNTIDYKVYYIKLRPDYAGSEAKSPSEVDEVLTSYNGSYLTYVTTTTTVNGVNTTTKTLTPKPFEYVSFPSSYFQLDRTIKGWSKIFPLFKSGTKDISEGPNPTLYSNFGAGIIFIPSGLGYYSISRSNIPSYSPLVFSFKLYEVQRADQDDDGILSNDEDINHDGIFTNDDTDGDGIQDYLDTDDDGDGYLTKYEIKRPNIFVNGVSTPNGYYPYNGTVDDPTTPNIDESQGVPRKFTGPVDNVTHLPTPLPSDFTDPTRTRRYLDKTSFPPYQ